MKESLKPPIKPFIFEDWRVWQGTAHIILSNQPLQLLKYFKDVDKAINWLFLNGHKEAARKLNEHKN